MELSVNVPPFICFFDSGIGGLTLFYECTCRLPRADFAYFADNYNVPYGNLSQEKLMQKVDAVFAHISNFQPAAAVIACNTVTARCAEFLRKKYSFPIVGIQPAIKPAAAAGGKCLVLATPATASSAPVNELVIRYGKGHTEVVPCPDLAAFIENNIFTLSEKQNELSALLPDIKADSVVLGCTHYVFIKELIKKRYGCPVYDGLEGTAKRLCDILGKSNHQGTKDGRNVMFIGGDAEKNVKVFRRFPWQIAP